MHDCILLRYCDDIHSCIQKEDEYISIFTTTSQHISHRNPLLRFMNTCFTFQIYDSTILPKWCRRRRGHSLSCGRKCLFQHDSQYQVLLFLNKRKGPEIQNPHLKRVKTQIQSSNLAKFQSQTQFFQNPTFKGSKSHNSKGFQNPIFKF